jgi:pyridoxamine 5'-phosphate oxidase
MTDEIAEDEPFAPFARWFELAAQAEPLAETMTLATATRDGMPSLRAVLLKGADERGFVFYTNLESRKAGELFANPRAALGFHWKSLARRSASRYRRAGLRGRDRRLSRPGRATAGPAPSLRPVAPAGSPRRSNSASCVQPAGAERPSCRDRRPGRASGRPQRIEFWQDGFGCMIGFSSFAMAPKSTAGHGARNGFSHGDHAAAAPGRYHTALCNALRLRATWASPRSRWC